MTTNHETALQPADLVFILANHRTVRVLDVRTRPEFETAHIRDSYNVPVDSLADHASDISDVHAPLVLVCHSGQRASRARAILAASGHPDLHVLDGGMRQWLAAGYPVVRGRARLSLERQVRIAAGVLAASGALLSLWAAASFALIPLFVGSGLIVAGLTDKCGLAMVLARLPYNRAGASRATEMVRALRVGDSIAASHIERPVMSCINRTRGNMDQQLTRTLDVEETRE